MKKLIKITKYRFLILSGFFCGIISTFWLGWSILFAGNIMAEPGSYHYEEAESFRPYGITGIIFYVICFGTLLFYFKKNKISFPAFLIPMLFGILSVCTFYIMR